MGHKNCLGRATPYSELKFLTNKEIKLLRKRLGISQQAFSRLIGIKSWVTVSRWERSKNIPSGLKVCRTIARVKELFDNIGNRLAPEELVRFLSSPHLDLYNDEPANVLSTETGYYSVRTIIENLLAGEYN